MTTVTVTVTLVRLHRHTLGRRFSCATAKHSESQASFASQPHSHRRNHCLYRQSYLLVYPKWWRHPCIHFIRAYPQAVNPKSQNVNQNSNLHRSAFNSTFRVSVLVHTHPPTQTHTHTHSTPTICFDFTCAISRGTAFRVLGCFVFLQTPQSSYNTRTPLYLFYSTHNRIFHVSPPPPPNFFCMCLFTVKCRARHVIQSLMIFKNPLNLSPRRNCVQFYVWSKLFPSE